MSEFIVFSSHMKSQKGKLPDIFYSYIANDSMIPYHYTITHERDNAYLFDETELNDAELIADSWNMKVKEVKGE